MSLSEPLYDDKQANEILRTAVRLASPQEITFEELVLAAAELGLSREDLQEAERQYAESSTEAGQRREFRRMQRDQLKSFAFHLGFGVMFLTLIGATISWKVAIVTCALAAVAAVVVGMCLRKGLADEESPENIEKFQAWTAKKRAWLRPERASELVHETLREQVKEDNYMRALEGALRDRMGYDRKRAREVLRAYLRQHPDLEVRRSGDL